MGTVDDDTPAKGLSKQQLRDKVTQLSYNIEGLSEEILLVEGIKAIEEYTLLIDQILSVGFEGEAKEDVMQVVAAHKRVVSTVEKITDQLSTQQRDVMQKMRGILRYLDSLPASISISGSKKG